jgi:hypothetical protein
MHHFARTATPAVVPINLEGVSVRLCDTSEAADDEVAERRPGRCVGNGQPALSTPPVRDLRPHAKGWIALTSGNVRARGRLTVPLALAFAIVISRRLRQGRVRGG